MSSALHGVRVLDLADHSGAHCGKLLADMGAEVVKVEPPGGDASRHIGPYFHEEGDPEQSLFFWHYNTSKRSLVLDLAGGDGVEALRRLARASDVVIETGAPGSLDARGLGYRHLSDIAPHLVVASITPFGQSGPRRDWRSSDTVAQAMGGMIFVNGHADEAPLRGFGLQAYHGASTYAAIAILLALLRRDRGGGGTHIDVSVQACVAAAVEHVSGFFHQTGGIEVRRGSLHWSRSFRIGRCRNGHVMHCTLGDWTALVEWIKGDGKAQDLDQPEWSDFEYRQAHCEHLFDVLDEWARDYRVADLVEGAQLRRVPYAPVLAPETLRDDPHLAAREFFADVNDEQLSARVRYPGAPYRFGATPWKIHRRPPRIGEHGEDILARAATDIARPRPQHSTSDAKRRPLEGIRIIDFTWVVAGPVATRILCDQGAEVIKIERRGSTDFGTRRGGLTGNLNRGKQSIVLNMSQPDGVALARELIARADVVIDNFSARVMPNWGLDYERLRGLKPDIIAVGMSGFGCSGPYRDYVSYGPTLQALTGFTALMRHPGRAPAGWGFSYSDMAGGLHAALAVLLALWHRARSGEGQFVDLSQFESLAALVGVPLLSILAKGAPVETSGNRSLEAPAAPHGVYRCADRAPDHPGARQRNDRWCAITVFGEDDWARFVAALGAPEWTRAPKFATLESRLRHPDELDAHVNSWTRTRSAEDAMQTLQAAGVAAGVVADAEDLCERDPQLRHRGYWVEVETPEGERVCLDGVPFLFDGVAAGPTAPGPLLGEHTDAILRRFLGLTEARIAALRAAGTIE